MTLNHDDPNDVDCNLGEYLDNKMICGWQSTVNWALISLGNA